MSSEVAIPLSLSLGESSPRMQRLAAKIDEKLEAKLNPIVVEIQELAKKIAAAAQSHGAELENVTDKLHSVTQIQDDRTVLQQQLQELKEKITAREQQIQQEFEILKRGQFESEQQRLQLQDELENRVIEAQEHSDAIARIMLHQGQTMAQLEEEKKKSAAASAKVSEQAQQISSLTTEKGQNTILIGQQAQKITAGAEENRVLKAASQATANLLELAKQECKQWKEVSAQQKTAIVDRDQLIQSQSKRLVSVESNLISNEPVKKLAEKPNEKTEEKTQQEQTAKKLSPLAIAAIIAIAIVLAIVIACWLNPALASATGEVFRRGWSHVTSAAPAA